ncbi:MAG TPA: membrane protein insertase YidC, partial [Nocardioidaceae bacterium]|nr:membrane protein insertase YidC [Nocardioidaceae bacterium]
PLGVLFYWTTSNLWTMGQQFYVIRNNPAPGTPAFRAKETRDAEKAKRHGILPRPHSEPPAEAEPPAAPEPPRRQQPKKQSRSQRRGSSRKPSGPRSQSGPARPKPGESEPGESTGS